MRAELEPAVARLTELALRNPSGREERDTALDELERLDEGLSRVRTRLDGLRLIFVGAAT